MAEQHDPLGACSAPDPAPRLLPHVEAAIRRRDLDAVDREARRLGQHPLDPITRAFRADIRQAVRERRARDAARRAATQPAHQGWGSYPHEDHLHIEVTTRGIDRATGWRPPPPGSGYFFAAYGPADEGEEWPIRWGTEGGYTDGADSEIRP